MDGIKQIAERIKGLRLLLDVSVSDIAKSCKMTEEEYLEREKGENDFTFSFLNACATRFGVDLAELITGENAHLKSYTIERKGGGLSVDRRAGFDYRHLASRFNGRNIEPYCVTVPFIKGIDAKAIKTNTHDGQEMDFVLEGTLIMSINGYTEILNEGDCITYNSSLPHGMIAGSESGCKFLALLTK